MEPNVNRAMWGIIGLLSAIIIGGVLIISYPKLTGKISNGLNDSANQALTDPDSMPGWMGAMEDEDVPNPDDVNIDDLLADKDKDKDKDIPTDPNEFDGLTEENPTSLQEIMDGSDDILGGTISFQGDTKLYENNLEEDGSFVIGMEGQYNGLRIRPKNLKPNTTYKFSYTYREIASEKHELLTMGSHVDANWVPAGVYVDGVYNSPDPQIWDSAFVSGKGSHKVELYMHYLPSTIGGEKKESDTIWIQPNRGLRQPGIAKISNVKIEELSSTTPERVRNMKDKTVFEAMTGVDKSLVEFDKNAGTVKLKATPEGKRKGITMKVDGKAGKIYNVKMKINTQNQALDGRYRRFVRDIDGPREEATDFFYTNTPPKEGWVEYDLYLKLTYQDGPNWSNLGVMMYGSSLTKEVNIKDIEIYELGYSFD